MKNKKFLFIKIVILFLISFTVLAVNPHSDLDNNRRVDGSDFTLFARNFGKRAARGDFSIGDRSNADKADLNNNGEVDGSDFTIFSFDFGKTVTECTPNWQDSSECSGCIPSCSASCTGSKTQSDGCGNNRTVACAIPAVPCTAMNTVCNPGSGQCEVQSWKDISQCGCTPTCVASCQGTLTQQDQAGNTRTVPCTISQITCPAGNVSQSGQYISTTPTITSVYWADANGNPITEAYVGDTVQLIAVSELLSQQTPTGDVIAVTGRLMIGPQCECSRGEDKCEGKDYYYCGDCYWIKQGKVVDKCGVECLEGEENCDNNKNYYDCYENQWRNRGQVVGKCGYTGAPTESTTIQTPETGGRQTSFAVYDSGNNNVHSDSGPGAATWQPSQSGTYYFTAALADNPSNLKTSPNLIVRERGAGISQAYWADEYGNPISEVGVGQTVYLVTLIDETTTQTTPTGTVIGLDATITGAVAITQGLIAYYPFDGKVNDASGNRKHLHVAHAGPSFTTGIKGQAASFNGQDSYVRYPSAHYFSDDYFNLHGAFTLEAWVKPNSLGQRMTLIGTDHIECGTQWKYGSKGYRLNIEPDGKPKFKVSPNAGQEATVTSGTQIYAGEWSQVVATYDQNSGLKIYVNGVQTGINFQTPYSTSEYPRLTIGGCFGDQYGGSYTSGDQQPHLIFNGLIDDVKVYNRALTPGEIASSFSEITGGTPEVCDGQDNDNDGQIDENMPSCCNGVIHDLQVDNNNCGSCGNVCSDDRWCRDGVCELRKNIYVDLYRECGGQTPCYGGIQEGIDAAQHGDTVYIYPGDYKLSSPVEVNKEIALSGLEGQERPVLIYTGESPYQGVIHLSRGNVVIRRIEAASLGLYHGYLISDQQSPVSNWVVDDVKVHDSRSGVLAYGDNVQVINSEFYHTNRAMIRLYGHGSFTVKNNWLHDSNACGDDTYGIEISENRGNSGTSEIAYNYITAACQGIGINNNPASKIIIHHNTIDGEWGADISRSGIVFKAQQITSSNIEIRDNIINHMPWYGIYSDASLSGNLNIQNSIFWDNKYSEVNNKQQDWQGQVGWGDVGDDFVFTNSQVADPLFLGDPSNPSEFSSPEQYYALRGGSPTLNTATGGTNIGAWQGAPVTTPTPSTGEIPTPTQPLSQIPTGGRQTNFEILKFAIGFDSTITTKSGMGYTTWQPTEEGTYHFKSALTETLSDETRSNDLVVVRKGVATERDTSKYSDKQVFLISSKNWWDVLSLVPIAVWTKAGQVRKYPLLIYLDQTTNPELMKDKKFDIDSSIGFMQQWGAEKAVIVGQYPKYLASLLVVSPETGAGLSQDNIMQVPVSQMLDYWNDFEKVVYVEANYETALLAATYASLINSPLVVKDSSLDREGTFINRQVICAGDVNHANGCAERYTLEQLQDRYTELTNTDKIILANANDFNMGIDSYYNTEKTVWSFDTKISKMASLAAPILASAKHELIISTNNQEAPVAEPCGENDVQIVNIIGAVDNVIEAKDELLRVRPKYLTIVASPKAIPDSRYAGSCTDTGGGTMFSIRYSVDQFEYSDNNHHGDSYSFWTSRIYGFSITDVSSYIARSLFYQELFSNLNINTYSAISLAGLHPEDDWPADVTSAKEIKLRTSASGYDSDCYTTKQSSVDCPSPPSGECGQGLAADRFKERQFIAHMGHSDHKSWEYYLNSYCLLPVKLKLPFVVSDGCMSMGFFVAEEKQDIRYLTPAILIRTGAIAAQGNTGISPSYEGVSYEAMSKKALRLLTTGQGMELGELALSLKDYKIPCNHWACYNGKFFTTIGDPTLKPNFREVSW